MKILTNLINSVSQFFSGLWGRSHHSSYDTLKGMAPTEKAEWFLDKGFITAPKWLSRADKIKWVYRSRPQSFWV